MSLRPPVPKERVFGSCDTYSSLTDLEETVSEGYFLHTVPLEWTHSPTDTRELAASKAYRLLRESTGTVGYSEFGTRRRRSYKVQKEVLEGLREGEGRYWAEVGGRGEKRGGLGGTSNVSRLFGGDSIPP